MEKLLLLCTFLAVGLATVLGLISLSRSRNSYERLIFTNANYFALSRAISPVVGIHDKPNTSAFDSDFAESLAKPLPQWYQESLVERERLMKELEKNRDRIMQEFKAKYEVSEKEKFEEKRFVQDRFRKRMERKRKSGNEQGRSWLGKVFGGEKSTNSLFADEDSETLPDSNTDLDDDISTKEKWDLFWKEEEEQTGFYLPGFFEVFPELKLKWPTWARRKDGTALKCETDADCPFPNACCPHPIIPGDKFCCTGWGRRVLVPAYARQEISTESVDSDATDGKPKGDPNSKENWRPEN